MESPLSETWRISHRINLYLLDAIAEEHLSDQAGGKGRTVGETFAHLHNTRILWLNVAAPALLQGIEKIEKQGITKQSLSQQLDKSAGAIAQLFEQSAQAGKIKGFKPHATAFLGYLASHEAHHRGQIVLALKLSGHPIDKKTGFGMWEWGVR